MTEGEPGKFYILSVDGGGLKGLIAIKILQIVEQVIQKNIYERFSLIAGTSTGGLIASALAAGNENLKPLYDLKHIEEIYLHVGQSVFMQGGISWSGKEAEKFDKILSETFNGKKISETLRPLFIPAYNAGTGKIVIFKTRSAIQDPGKDVTLKDACRATSAIPPVFPPYSFIYRKKNTQFIDAGIHLKNPAVAALAEVWKHKSYYGVANEEDIVLLSVSTGSHRRNTNEWSTEINDILNVQTLDMKYISTQKIDINYKKINFLRVDLNLGGSTFSLSQVFEWLRRLESLSNNEQFRHAIKELLV